ncbi:MAG: hypothetical protein FWE68_06225 [Defluviitaleaceae bacterium]|nr:hypothetical protein [Defluviitaleaceae bacterium]
MTFLKTAQSAVFVKVFGQAFFKKLAGVGSAHSSHWNFAECQEAFGYSLDDFLFFGGYPGAAALIKDENRWARYMGTSIVTKWILSLRKAVN